ncbi:MAG TPA: hypothetical protein VFK05_28280, partial [Polyangiaceae bacterium]|nr:hypothetical protein [Polyangiaceae bacterium]
MRKRLLLPLCLLTGFGCDGTYVLGTVIGSGGSGNSSSGSGNSNSGSGHGNPGSSGSGNPTGANGGDAANVGGGSNAGAGGHYPAAGSGAVGPQFACDQVGSQQFDPAHMQAYSVTPQVSANVNETLKAMGQDAKALQMMGVPVGAMDYYDLERGPHVEVPGVGTLRGYNFRDGNHGVNLEAGQKNSPTDGKDFSTAFPTPSIRAASWDL